MTASRRCTCGAAATRMYCSSTCREREKKRRARRRRTTRQPGPRRDGGELDLFAAAGVVVTASERNQALAAAAAAQHAVARVARDSRAEIEALTDDLDQAHDDARALATEVLVLHAARGWADFYGPVREIVERYVAIDVGQMSRTT